MSDAIFLGTNWGDPERTLPEAAWPGRGIPNWSDKIRSESQLLY